VTEWKVDLHVMRSVEEGEQPVTCHSRLVESVDQEACCTLGTPAARRRDDMKDERASFLAKIRRHLRAASYWSPSAAIAP
jgi:hypothetical protein